MNEYYAQASQRAHTNLMSSMRHVQTLPSGNESAFSLIEIMPRAADLTIKTYLHWTCLVHMDIIGTVTKVIFPEFDSNNSDFQAAQNSLDELMDKLAEHIAQLDWKSKKPEQKPD